MRIIDASDDKQHFFVRVTADGRLLYARRPKLTDDLDNSARRFALMMHVLEPL